MAEEKQPPKENGFWQKLPPGVRYYIIFCCATLAATAYANHMGWFPTYGIFSGNNSLHSPSTYHGSGVHGGYHGGFGHGK